MRRAKGKPIEVVWPQQGPYYWRDRWQGLRPRRESLRLTKTRANYATRL